MYLERQMSLIGLKKYLDLTIHLKFIKLLLSGLPFFQTIG